MDDWRPSSVLSSRPEERYSCSNKILAVGSGNVQTYALDTKEGVENQNPFQHSLPNYPSPKILPSHCAAPGQTLTSNDPQAAALRLIARRQRREQRHLLRPESDRRFYLTNKKYLDYRARHRRDTQADGKVVWSNLVEDAFQDALVHIEPMGQNKRSQHNKPYGRNELIAEWIYEATGERRSRKQVSSHIQVLNGLLKGIPEWDAVTKMPKNVNGRGKREHEYFENSIALKVKEKYHGSYLSGGNNTNISHGGTLPPPAYTLRSNSIPVDRHHIAALNFEMWISPDPGHTSNSLQCLHNYTRLQSSHSSADPIPLENIQGWRQTFPRLSELLESSRDASKYDIILLEANFKLLSDFPPRRAQLGISLELDFVQPNPGNATTLGGLLGDWMCTTYMYQRGQLINEPTSRECHEINIGKIKPAFESTWWANAFIRLTEKQRRAEDTGDDATIHAMQEESRDFFRSLSIMQELRTSGSKIGRTNGISDDIEMGQTAAILLWKFSQAQPPYVGITTWQRLIQPPERLAANSPPLNAEELALPPLALDTMVAQVPNTLGFGHQEPWPGPDHHQPYDLYDRGMEEHTDFMGQDSFEMSLKDEDISSFAGMHSSFDLATAPPEHTNPSFHGSNHVSYVVQTGNMDMIHHPPSQVATVHPFEEGHHARESSSCAPHEAHRGDGSDTRESREQGQRGHLMDFDHNTHRLLQAQLAEHDNEHHDQHDRHHEALTEALVAASAMNDLGARDLILSTQEQQHSRQPAGFWEASPAARPILESHVSYTSQHSHHTYMQVSSRSLADNDAFNANQLATVFPGHESVPTQPITPMNASCGDDEHGSHTNLFATEAHLGFPVDPDAHLGQGLGGSFVDVKLEELDS